MRVSRVLSISSRSLHHFTRPYLEYVTVILVLLNALVLTLEYQVEGEKIGTALLQGIECLEPKGETLRHHRMISPRLCFFDIWKRVTVCTSPVFYLILLTVVMRNSGFKMFLSLRIIDFFLTVSGPWFYTPSPNRTTCTCVPLLNRIQTWMSRHTHQTIGFVRLALTLCAK